MCCPLLVARYLQVVQTGWLGPFGGKEGVGSRWLQRFEDVSFRSGVVEVRQVQRNSCMVRSVLGRDAWDIHYLHKYLPSV
jgi:hypothetical protein